MYAEGGWKPSWEPPPRKRQLTKRQERVFLWLIAVNMLLLLVAPIGGATIILAVLAALRHGQNPERISFITVRVVLHSLRSKWSSHQGLLRSIHADAPNGGNGRKPDTRCRSAHTIDRPIGNFAIAWALYRFGPIATHPAC